MPRRPRLVLPGIPMHITQRGVNRAAVFVDDSDCARYRDLLDEVASAHDLAVHAYALMGNHVHLLMTANEAPDLARAMRLLNQRYVAAFNRRHGRTGTLWEGRFRSCLVQNENYLLMVYRYIDLNPVRAAMVDSAGSYPWSSAKANLGLAADPSVTPHPAYLSVGANPCACAAFYRQWLDAGVSEAELASVRKHMQQERALGDARFQAMLGKSLNRPVAVRARGRPRNVIGGVFGEIDADISNG